MQRIHSLWIRCHIVIRPRSWVLLRTSDLASGLETSDRVDRLVRGLDSPPGYTALGDDDGLARVDLGQHARGLLVEFALRHRLHDGMVLRMSVILTRDSCGGTFGIAELGDRAERFEALRAVIATTPADAMESYSAEVAEWDRIDRG